LVLGIYLPYSLLVLIGRLRVSKYSEEKTPWYLHSSTKDYVTGLAGVESNFDSCIQKLVATFSMHHLHLCNHEYEVGYYLRC